MVRPATFGLEAGLVHTLEYGRQEEKLHDDAVTMKREVISLLEDGWKMYREGMELKRSKVREIQEETIDSDYDDQDFENANALFQKKITTTIHLKI